ncbi:MAG: DNA polymerase III subunit gamma/tau, partial [Zoogloea sp.]|nr:DNA polymerase III subunit gamma/tau [Zoogloea sp.]
PPPAVVAAPEPVAPEPEPAAPPAPAPASVAAVVAEAAPAAADSGEPLPADIDWHALQEHIGLGGFNLQLAQHSELVSVDGRLLKLRLANDQRHLLQINRSGPEKLQEALSAHFGVPVRVAIEVGEIATVTPAQRNQAEKTERHAAAVVALEQDPFVRELIARFDATLEVASVRPL